VSNQETRSVANDKDKLTDLVDGVWEGGGGGEDKELSGGGGDGGSGSRQTPRMQAWQVS
jgi:hypothetical protein